MTKPDFRKINRLRLEMATRDYEGVTTALSADIHELLFLAKQLKQLLKEAIDGQIDEAWRTKAKELVDEK